MGIEQVHNNGLTHGCWSGCHSDTIGEAQQGSYSQLRLYLWL